MANVKITRLEKNYAGVPAVRGIDLEIADGEFTVLVGPSGCGKSTLLRTIAGLEDIDGGTIEIGGEVVNEMRPRDRDVAMVFQDYALYPHMTVHGNISLSLKARNTPKPEIEQRVQRAAAMLGIGSLLQRYPRQLSGGQRQRVAIGRAIVRNPRVFLFDEPLSNLDAQLRDEMRGEIKRLHQELGTTMIYVTHDQIEAMTLADRIVLLKEGLVEQVGSPLDLYERPATRFVAGFLGSPKMNFIPGELVMNGAATVRFTDGATLALPAGRRVPAEWSGRKVIFGIRPQHFGRDPKALSGEAAPVRAEVELLQPTGSRAFITFPFGGAATMAELASHDVQRPGETIELYMDISRAILIDPESGRVL
jgi:multiple sugar transport system ATP-binding protein